MENTGNGEKDQAKIGNRLMAENSTSSRKRGKKNITKDEHLEILQAAVRRCQDAGIKVRASQFYEQGSVSTIIVLECVDIVNGNFVPMEEC